MSGVRNTSPFGFNYQVITGANAGVTVKPKAGVIGRVRVWVAGDASSSVAVYDGTTQVDLIDSTVVNGFDIYLYAKTYIKFVTVNPNGLQKITVTWL